MKRNNFLWFSLPVLSILTFAIAGCESKKTKDQAILGEWNAHWQTKIDAGLPGLTQESLSMNGLINFKSDGKVDISAYGYEGCIFSDDTIKNTLSWKMDDTVLRFIDAGDDHGLPYTITKFTDEELQLTLLEDINLTLYRNGQ
ncbi:MAG: hypothetical protein HC819_08465 [Cyclobacteriaceae bacterium]|nr:hypothetical protein [Cyclobacteriaceae bacterium]